MDCDELREANPERRIIEERVDIPGGDETKEKRKG